MLVEVVCCALHHVLSASGSWMVLGGPWNIQRRSRRQAALPSTSSPTQSHHVPPTCPSLLHQSTPQMLSRPMGTSLGWLWVRKQRPTCISLGSSRTRATDHPSSALLKASFPYTWPTHQRQSTMPTHTMSKNANPLAINLLEILKHRLRQFLRDIAIHLIPLLRPRRFGGVDIEARAAAEVVGLIFALNFKATWSPFISA